MSLLTDYLINHPEWKIPPNNSILIKGGLTQTVEEMAKAIATECMLSGVDEVKITVFAEIDGWKHLVDEKIIKLS